MKNIKKIVSLVLVVSVLFSLGACKSKEERELEKLNKELGKIINMAK